MSPSSACFNAPKIVGDILLLAGTAAAFLALSKTKNRSGGDVGLSGLSQDLRDGTSLDAKERICTVDENNKPLPGGHFRHEMRLHKIWHRATYVLVSLEDPKDPLPSSASTGSGVSLEGLSRDDPYVLVQRRSVRKDYCPGKLDPLPGGVVGYGETYYHNATRELSEEMGIDVTSPGSPHTLIRLFTFPYQDDNVKVWGDFYEACYRGKLEDLVLQEAEVESLERMTMAELKRRITYHPEDFMPDAIHALHLYFQRKEDKKLNRKLLKGYSSGNLDAYRLRPRPKVVFFDCDDCLYFDGWKVANMLTRKIEEWCGKKGLKEGEAYELYKKYGTALRGLLEEGYIEHTDENIDGFLEDVHDIGVGDHIQADPRLREMILNIDPAIPKYIFTASVRHHAERCLKALGIDGLFDGIIDVKDCELETKHDRRSFELAMKIAGVTDPESCLFLDDSLKNLHTAREMGWRSVLVGRVGRDCGSQISSDHAEHEIDRIHDFPLVFPELFAHKSEIQ